MGNNVHDFAEVAKTYSAFIQGVQSRKNSWGIKSEDKREMAKFDAYFDQIPTEIPERSIRRYLDSAFTPSHLSFGDYATPAHIASESISQLIRDVKAIRQFGWNKPFEEWKEYPLLMAEPTNSYDHYVRSNLEAIIRAWGDDLFNTMQQIYTTNRWFQILDDPVMNFMNAKNRESELVQRIIYKNTNGEKFESGVFFTIQALLEKYSLRAFKWEDGILSLEFDTFRFCRSEGTIKAIFPSYIREQGLEKRFPSQVLKYVCEQRFLPHAILGTRREKKGAKASTQSKGKYAGLIPVHILQECIYEALQSYKSTQTEFSGFCYHLNEVYEKKFKEIDKKSELTMSPSSEEFNTVVDNVKKQYERSGLRLGEWVLKLSSDEVEDIFNSNRSLLAWATPRKWVPYLFDTLPFPLNDFHDLPPKAMESLMSR